MFPGSITKRPQTQVCYSHMHRNQAVVIICFINWVKFQIFALLIAGSIPLHKPEGQRSPKQRCASSQRTSRATSESAAQQGAVSNRTSGTSGQTDCQGPWIVMLFASTGKVSITVIRFLESTCFEYQQLYQCKPVYNNTPLSEPLVSIADKDSWLLVVTTPAVNQS